MYVIWIQWRSEIQTSLNFKWWKQVGLQMVRISNGIWNREAQPLEIRTNGCHFVKNYLKSGKSLVLNGLVFEWLGQAINIAEAGPFENWTNWNPDQLKSDLLKVRILHGRNGRISDPHCTRTHRINLSFEWIFVRWWRHCLNIFENVAAVRLCIAGFVVSLIKSLLERRELIDNLRAQVLVLKNKRKYYFLGDCVGEG